jgi:hypothetical protein
VTPPILDKLTDKLEASRTSPVKMFLLGVAVSIVIWLVSRTRKKLVHRKEYLIKKSEALLVVDFVSKTTDEQARILDAIRLNRNAAKVIGKKIAYLDKKIENTENRINSARSFDDLEDL